MRLQLLSERQFTNHPEHGRIFVNPTPEEARMLRRARGFVDEDNTVWLWGYENGYHNKVAKALGEQIKVAFYVWPSFKDRPYTGQNDIDDDTKYRVVPSINTTPNSHTLNVEKVLSSNECIRKLGMAIDMAAAQ